LVAHPSRNKAWSQRYQTPHAEGAKVRQDCCPVTILADPGADRPVSANPVQDGFTLTRYLRPVSDASLAILTYHFEERSLIPSSELRDTRDTIDGI
jgi:hypothetical protein